MVSDNPETFADLDGHCSMDQEVCETGPTIGGPTDPGSTNKNVCNAETGKCDNANANVNGNDQDKAQENNRTGYSTANEAAKAALKSINPTSIRENREYAGYIYRDKSGRYHYTGPAKGSDQGSCPCDAKAPRNSTIVGNYHTHGNYSVLGPNGRAVATGDPHRDEFNSDHFSRGARGDTGVIADMAKSHPGFLGYLGTPSGRFLIYDPATGKERELQ